MATSSEVSVGLAAIAAIISEQRQVLLKAKANGTSASEALGAIPTQFADLVTTIQGFGTSNAFEANAKAKLGKFAAEYNALKVVADAVAAISP